MTKGYTSGKKKTTPEKWSEIQEVREPKKNGNHKYRQC